MDFRKSPWNSSPLCFYAAFDSWNNTQTFNRGRQTTQIEVRSCSGERGVEKEAEVEEFVLVPRAGPRATATETVLGLFNFVSPVSSAGRSSPVQCGSGVAVGITVGAAPLQLRVVERGPAIALALWCAVPSMQAAVTRMLRMGALQLTGLLLTVQKAAKCTIKVLGS